jgi:hypothetical protein
MRVAVCINRCSLAIAACLSISALAKQAVAQQPAAPAPPSPTSYAAAPAPVPAPAATPIIRPYALIKPTIVVSSSGVESFGQPNATAATAAGNPVLAAIQDEAHTTFQVGQSRLGFWFADKAPVRGQFELDFIDFAKSSPTTGSVPRLRIAKVEWQLTDGLLLAAGQDWDLFQPVNPHSFNIVSVAYQAGNSAFMRQQAKFIYASPSFELAGALGLAGINNGARALIPEYSRIPSVAARAALLFGTAGRIGVSAIGTSWRFAPDTPTERKAFAGSAGLYGDVTPAEGFNLRFEAYVGQNLANMGALTLGTGNAAEDLSEVGGFLSAKYSLTENHALYATVGTARVLNDEDVVAAYSYAGMLDPAMPPAASAATISGTGPGMVWNNVLRVGYEYRYDKTIAFLLEGFGFQSKHVLEPTIDALRFDDEQTAFGTELGLLFTL